MKEESTPLPPKKKKNFNSSETSTSDEIMVCSFTSAKHQFILAEQSSR